MGVRNDVMTFFRMEGEGGEQEESTNHPIFPLIEHTEEWPKATQEGYYNLFVEGSSPHTASLGHECFEEVFRPPLYDTYEDEYSKY